jgi:hypothetical protein
MTYEEFVPIYEKAVEIYHEAFMNAGTGCAALDKAYMKSIALLKKLECDNPEHYNRYLAAN